MKYVVFLFCSLFWIACNPAATETDVPIEISDASISNENTLVVKEKCAVILAHSTAEIDAMRKEYSENDFAEVASDIGFYNATATENLTVKGIKVVSTDKEEITFVQSDGVQTTIKRKEYEKDLVFFSPEQKPLGTFTADFEKDLPYFGITKGNEFVEGYWVGMEALDNAGKNHIFKYFYKTSFINDKPLLQVFDGGDILVEEVLLEQKDGTFKQGKEDIFYEFKDGEDITITELGSIRGLIHIRGNSIKE